MWKMEQAQAQPLCKRRAAAGSASVPLAGRLWNMPAWQLTVADGGGCGDVGLTEASPGSTTVCLWWTGAWLALEQARAEGGSEERGQGDA